MKLRFIIFPLCNLLLLQTSCTLDEEFTLDNPKDPNSRLYIPEAVSISAFPLVNSEGIYLSIFVAGAGYISAFVVERRAGNDPYTRIAELPGTARLYTDTTITANVAYTYRVTSIWGRNSATSNASTATWAFAPPTNVNFFVPMAGTGVGIAWSSYTGLASGFLLERSSDGMNFQEVLRVPNDARTAVDSSATPGNQYSYRLRSYTSRNLSGPSNVVQTQFLPVGLHALPTKTLVAAPSSLAFSPDGRHWVSGSGVSCFVWTLGTSIQLLEIQNPIVTAVASSGSMAAVSGTSRSIAFRFEPFGTFVITPALRGKAIAFSPDGSRIAVCISQGIAISSSGTGAQERTITYDSTRSVAYRPDGSMIAAGADGRVGIWMATSGSLVRTILVPGTLNIRVGFSSDGSKLVGGGTDSVVRVWDVATGTEVNSWNTGTSITALAVKGTKVLTAGSADAYLWDIASGTIDQTFPSGGLIPTSADLSRNTRIVMVGYTNGTVRSWSLGNHWWPAP